MQVWSRMDGAALARGQVCEKWNVAELDTCQRWYSVKKAYFS